MGRWARQIGGLSLLAWLSSALLAPTVLAQNGTIAPAIRHQFFDSAGAVCSGCLLNAYAAGTSTRLDTYSNVTLTTLNANPVVMDSAGRRVVHIDDDWDKAEPAGNPVTGG